MASDYLERCNRAVAALLVPAYPDPETRTWKAAQIAGAVLEAGRLSECPAAVDAAGRRIKIGFDPNYAPYGEYAVRVLRAAEDAAMGEDQ
jgi:hypothetical protein